MKIEKMCLIGLAAEVLESKNKHNIGIKGKIRDETKYTLQIENKKIMKSSVILRIKEQNINGKKLLGRPEERIKKR